MNWRNVVGLTLLFVILLSPQLQVNSQTETTTPTWEPVGPGIEYRQYELDDPNNVFVARMDRTNPDVILESSIAAGGLLSGKETVSDMASRYDEALNLWGQTYITRTWGTRSQVVVAINGSFYDIPTGYPFGGMVHSGWYAKRFDDLGGGSGFAWKQDRSAFIGECISHPADKQIAKYVRTGVTQLISGVNVERGEDELILYTPQYDRDTRTDDQGVEVLVEMTRPTMILPEPAYASGFVREIYTATGSTPIPFDHIVLSASGVTTTTILLDNLVISDEIRISQELFHYESDCVTPIPSLWTKTYASLGGSFYFLKDGEIQTFTDPGALERHPRTAIAYNDDYIHFIVVDGRDSVNSIGMTIDELAIFARDVLSATWGVAQDGGGSSTMVVNGEVVNNTFCNIVYCITIEKSYLPMIIKGEIEESPPAPVAPTVLQRMVANGMMMVVVEAPEYSQVYQTGDAIITSRVVPLQLGPGSQYASLATVSEGTRGVVEDHLNGLSGVLAKGEHWWKVTFLGLTGWVPESAILPAGLYASCHSLGEPLSDNLCGIFYQLYPITRWFR